MPFELRPYPALTLRPEDSYLQNAWRNSVYPLARRMGIEIRLPGVSPQPYTRLAFEGLEFAKDRGAGDSYNSEVMRAFFQRSEDIGKIDVLAGAAIKSGLDGDQFRAALETGLYRERVQRLLLHSREEVRVTGVPLFDIGGLQLSGVQPADRLRAAIQHASVSEASQ